MENESKAEGYRSSLKALEVSELEFTYPGAKKPAVAGVSFDVNRGEILGLLGPNGAGKTTTVKILTTILPPSAGSVTIGGLDLSRHAVAARTIIGSVAQHTNLDLTVSVEENLFFHGKYFGLSSKESREKSRVLLEEFGLAEQSRARVRALSGGMMKRLMIARALVHDPVLLFLDEPTAGLDPQSRLFLWDRLKDLRRLGKAVLLATHDMVEAERLCDRVAIIDHGKVLACAAPSDLRSSLSGGETYHIEVLARDTGNGARERIQRALQETQGVQKVEEVPIDEVVSADGIRLAYRISSDASELSLATLAGAFDSVPYRLHKFGLAESTLEDVFISLTGRALRS